MPAVRSAAFQAGAKAGVVPGRPGHSAEESGAIAAFVQGGGYGLAAMLPMVAGLMRQHLADLTPAWWLMALLSVALGLIASCLRPGERIHNRS